MKVKELLPLIYDNEFIIIKSNINTMDILYDGYVYQYPPKYNELDIVNISMIEDRDKLYMCIYVSMDLS